MVREFVKFSFGIDAYVNNEGKIKKKFNPTPPVGWKEITESKVNKKHNACGIQCGELNEIYVVDYDNKNLFKKDLKQYPELGNYYVSTKNGYHSYFKWTPELQNDLGNANRKWTDNSEDIGIDFLGTDKFVIASGSYYTFGDRKYKYRLRSDKKIKEMSDELKNYFISEYIKPKNEYIQDMKEEKQVKHEVKYVDMDKGLIQSLIDIIDIKYLNQFDSWTKIIWSLASKGLKDEAIYASKKSPKYNDEDFEKFYMGFKEPRNNFSIGTFYHYCKISNEKEYYKIMSKHHDFKELNLMTDDEIALTFVKLYGSDFVYSKGIVYYFNGVYWQNNAMDYIKLKISKDLKLFYLDEYKRRVKDQEKEDKSLINLLKKIGNYKTQDNISKSILKFIKNDEIEWENNPYKFCFKNKVFDIKQGVFTEPIKEDYLYLNTGYDWVEPKEEDIIYLEEMIKKIFPVGDERRLYMYILMSGMIGKRVEKFVMANGSGGNGKGCLNELMLEMCGDYAYTANSAILLNPLSKDNNVDVAYMNDKRIIFYKEPDQSRKLIFDTIKGITGDTKINARKKYENESKVVIKGTHILECNVRPKINGKIDDSVYRRLIDIPFRTSFVKNPEQYTGDYIQKGDDNVKSSEFQNKYKIALFVLLCRLMKTYLEKEDLDLWIPKSVRERTDAYMEGCDELLNFFNENYERGGNEDVLQLKDMYLDFRQSDVYLNMNKSEKRTFNCSKFCDDIQSNIYLKKFYVEKLQKKFIKEKYGKTLMRNCLVGFKKKDIDYDSSDELNSICM